MSDTPALPPLPDLNRLEKRLNDATPDDLQPYERPDISVSCALALIAHVRALREENEALKRVLADLNNFHRHKFSEAVAAAEDALFKACSYNHTARAALAASRREGE